MAGKSNGARLAACLPLRMNLVPVEEKQRRRTAVLSGPHLEPTGESRFSGYERSDDPFSQLFARVDTLEQKLDALIDLMMRDQQQEARRAGVSLELHGEGISFRWPKALAVGETIELEITLSLYPAREIFFLAEVKTCEEEAASAVGEGQAPHHLVEARFAAISPSDHDAVHRFILISQRKQRRTERENESYCQLTANC
jgi:hypothetical protein